MTEYTIYHIIVRVELIGICNVMFYMVSSLVRGTLQGLFGMFNI